MPKYDAVLFDFDGVLLDSEPVHFACWAEVLGPLGVDLDWETYRQHCIGVADRAMLEFLAAGARSPVTVETLWQAYPIKNGKFLERVVHNPPFSPATIALIKELKPHYKLAVVSSSGSAEIEPLLAAGNLRHYFDAAVYGDDVERHKPAPEPYLLAASRLGIRVPLVVEDSAAGVESGRAAGFDVLHVKSAGDVAEAVRRQLATT